MRAEILSCGTELLLGHITDTNATYLAQSLAPLGIDLYYVSQVGDNQGRIVETLQRAWERSDLIIMTGGLGPTEDDLARESISALLGETMRVDPDLEKDLRLRFARMGVQMPESNVKQATLIPSARTIARGVEQRCEMVPYDAVEHGVLRLATPSRTRGRRRPSCPQIGHTMQCSCSWVWDLDPVNLAYWASAEGSFASCGQHGPANKSPLSFGAALAFPVLLITPCDVHVVVEKPA